MRTEEREEEGLMGAEEVNEGRVCLPSGFCLRLLKTACWVTCMDRKQGQTCVPAETRRTGGTKRGKRMKMHRSY